MLLMVTVVVEGESAGEWHKVALYYGCLATVYIKALEGTHLGKLYIM